LTSNASTSNLDPGSLGLISRLDSLGQSRLPARMHCSLLCSCWYRMKPSAYMGAYCASAVHHRELDWWLFCCILRCWSALLFCSLATEEPSAVTQPHIVCCTVQLDPVWHCACRCSQVAFVGPVHAHRMHKVCSKPLVPMLAMLLQFMPY